MGNGLGHGSDADALEAEERDRDRVWFFRDGFGGRWLFCCGERSIVDLLLGPESELKSRQYETNKHACMTAPSLSHLPTCFFFFLSSGWPWHLHPAFFSFRSFFLPSNNAGGVAGLALLGCFLSSRRRDGWIGGGVVRLLCGACLVCLLALPACVGIGTLLAFLAACEKKGETERRKEERESVCVCEGGCGRRF